MCHGKSPNLRAILGHLPGFRTDIVRRRSGCIVLVRFGTRGPIVSTDFDEEVEFFTLFLGRDQVMTMYAHPCWNIVHGAWISGVDTQAVAADELFDGILGADDR